MMKRTKPIKRLTVLLSLCVVLFGFLYWVVPPVHIKTQQAVVRATRVLFSQYDPFSRFPRTRIFSASSLQANALWRKDDLVRELRPLQIVLRDYENAQPYASRYPFAYQEMDEPKVARLRNDYSLTRFRTDPDFLGLVLLKDWLVGRFIHGVAPVGLCFNNFDALSLLGRLHQNATLDCGAFSYTYVQCVVALGAQARVVLLQDPHGNGHVVSEVWSNQWGKWIVMDVDHNVYYRRGAEPLNALELHDAFLNRTYQGIVAVSAPLHQQRTPTI